jgi:hypothetical protein
MDKLPEWPPIENIEAYMRSMLGEDGLRQYLLGQAGIMHYADGSMKIIPKEEMYLTPPNNTLHPNHSETAQERPASPASGAISKDAS